MKTYEIFISSKSEDYYIAEQVYKFLIKNNYTVFLASKELQKIGEAAYSIAVDKALDECTHMLVVSSSIEYIHSKWVKYEWNTFSNDIKSGYKEGNLVTILSDAIELKSLPASLRHQQSFKFNEYQKYLLGYLPHLKNNYVSSYSYTQDTFDTCHIDKESNNNNKKLTAGLFKRTKEKYNIFKMFAKDKFPILSRKLFLSCKNILNDWYDYVSNTSFGYLLKKLYISVTDTLSARSIKVNIFLSILLLVTFLFFLLYLIDVLDSDVTLFTFFSFFPFYAFLGATGLFFNKKAGLWMIGLGIYILSLFSINSLVLDHNIDNNFSPYIHSYFGHELCLPLLLISGLLSLGISYFCFRVINKYVCIKQDENIQCVKEKFIWSVKFQKIFCSVISILSVVGIYSSYEWKRFNYEKEEEFKRIHRYDNTKIGDYFYADGSTSSELDYNREDPIGIVFSLSPSDSERKAGYIHGEIISLSDAYPDTVVWGSTNYDVKEYYNHTNNSFNQINKMKLDSDGYKHIVQGFDTIHTVAAVIAKNYRKGQIRCLSSWYLPNASQWIEILQNLGLTEVSNNPELKFNCDKAAENLKKANIDSWKWYWINTEYDKDYAWSIKVNIGHFGTKTHKIGNGAYVRPVAAF